MLDLKKLAKERGGMGLEFHDLWIQVPYVSSHHLPYKIKKKKKDYLLFSSLGFFIPLVFFICLGIIHEQASIQKKQLPTTETDRKLNQ